MADSFVLALLLAGRRQLVVKAARRDGGKFNKNTGKVDYGAGWYKATSGARARTVAEQIGRYKAEQRQKGIRVCTPLQQECATAPLHHLDSGAKQ